LAPDVSIGHLGGPDDSSEFIEVPEETQIGKAMPKVKVQGSKES
jgi:hypothetical protein